VLDIAGTPTLGEKKANVKGRFSEQFHAIRTIFFSAGFLHLGFMPALRPRSAGVTAAATYAILCCVTALGAWGFFILLLLNNRDEHGRGFLDYFPLLFLVIAVVPPAVIGLGIRTAIGLLKLRAWARKASLFWAATVLALCLAIIAMRPFETFVIPQHFVSQAVLTRQLVVISFIFMLMPVSVWWLFYFRTKNVKLQFAAGDTQNEEGQIGHERVAAIT